MMNPGESRAHLKKSRTLSAHAALVLISNASVKHQTRRSRDEENSPPASRQAVRENGWLAKPPVFVGLRFPQRTCGS